MQPKLIYLKFLRTLSLEDPKLNCFLCILWKWTVCVFRDSEVENQLWIGLHDQEHFDDETNTCTCFFPPSQTDCERCRDRFVWVDETPVNVARMLLTQKRMERGVEWINAWPITARCCTLATRTRASCTSSHATNSPSGEILGYVWGFCRIWGRFTSPKHVMTFEFSRSDQKSVV